MKRYLTFALLLLFGFSALGADKDEVRHSFLACLRSIDMDNQNVKDPNGKKDFVAVGESGGEFGAFIVASTGTYFIPLSEKELNQKHFSVRFTLPGTERSIFLAGAYGDETGKDLAVKTIDADRARVNRFREVEPRVAPDADMVSPFRDRLKERMVEASKGEMDWLPFMGLLNDKGTQEYFKNEAGKEGFTKGLIERYQKGVEKTLKAHTVKLLVMHEQLDPCANSPDEAVEKAAKAQQKTIDSMALMNNEPQFAIAVKKMMENEMPNHISKVKNEVLADPDRLGANLQGYVSVKVVQVREDYMNAKKKNRAVGMIGDTVPHNGLKLPAMLLQGTTGL